MKIDPASGRPFFVDHANRTTLWSDPRLDARWAYYYSQQVAPPAPALPACGDNTVNASTIYKAVY